jgi:transposase-like protein
LEEKGFRKIERILKVSHVSVINWVKKTGAKLEKVPKKDEKVDVLELDELCINFLKTSGSRPQ